MAVELEAGLDAGVDDLDAIFDSNLAADSKKFWLNVAYDFLNERVNWGGYSTAEKTRMEAISAADAASSQDPRIKSERIGDARFDYQRDPNETDYWGMLLALDKHGDLDGAKSGKTPEFQAFGPGRGR